MNFTFTTIGMKKLPLIYYRCFRTGQRKFPSSSSSNSSSRHGLWAQLKRKWTGVVGWSLDEEEDFPVLATCERDPRCPECEECSINVLIIYELVPWLHWPTDGAFDWLPKVFWGEMPPPQRTKSARPHFTRNREVVLGKLHLRASSVVHLSPWTQNI